MRYKILFSLFLKKNEKTQTIIIYYFTETKGIIEKSSFSAIPICWINTLYDTSNPNNCKREELISPNM